MLIKLIQFIKLDFIQLNNLFRKSIEYTITLPFWILIFAIFYSYLQYSLPSALILEIYYNIGELNFRFLFALVGFVFLSLLGYLDTFFRKPDPLWGLNYNSWRIYENIRNYLIIFLFINFLFSGLIIKTNSTFNSILIFWLYILIAQNIGYLIGSLMKRYLVTLFIIIPFLIFFVKSNLFENINVGLIQSNLILLICIYFLTGVTFLKIINFPIPIKKTITFSTIHSLILPTILFRYQTFVISTLLFCSVLFFNFYKNINVSPKYFINFIPILFLFFLIDLRLYVDLLINKFQQNKLLFLLIALNISLIIIDYSLLNDYINTLIYPIILLIFLQFNIKYNSTLKLIINFVVITIFQFIIFNLIKDVLVSNLSKLVFTILTYLIIYIYICKNIFKKL